MFNEKKTKEIREKYFNQFLHWYIPPFKLPWCFNFINNFIFKNLSKITQSYIYINIYVRIKNIGRKEKYIKIDFDL